MASYVGQINSGGNNLPIAHTLYGTCGTAAATAAKVVTCANFDKLITGVFIIVKFTYGNTATSSVTLNVNNTGAISVRRFQGNTLNSMYPGWRASECVMFVYDGTYWQILTIMDVIALENTGSTAREVLLGGSNTDTDISTVYKSSKLTFTPSTGNLTVTKINGKTPTFPSATFDDDRVTLTF